MDEVEANENMDKAVACERVNVRPSSEVIYRIACERMEVSENLAKLNKAIKADPEAVSAYHKDLWRKQAKAMQDYVDVLGERIKDLIDNN
jgi:hypothetical protein